MHTTILPSVDAVSGTTDAGEVATPGFSGTLDVQSVACELVTCSAEDLATAFARARLAVALASVGAAHAVRRTQSISFVSLIGR